MTEYSACEVSAGLLAEVAAGAASGPDLVQVSWHVARCEPCRRELNEYLYIVDELRSAFPHRRALGGGA
jgi:anti-sigma factor ChrR (cupin superfamily)